MTTSYSYKLNHSPTLQGERFCSNQMVYAQTFHYGDAGQKHITSLLSDKKRKTTREYNKQIVDIRLCNTKVALHGDAIIIL